MGGSVVRGWLMLGGNSVGFCNRLKLLVNFVHVKLVHLLLPEDSCVNHVQLAVSCICRTLDWLISLTRELAKN